MVSLIDTICTIRILCCWFGLFCVYLQEVEERKKVVRHMWDVYTQSKSIRLPKFWQEAFEAAYEHLTNDVQGVRDAAVSEIAKMSLISINLDPPPGRFEVSSWSVFFFFLLLISELRSPCELASLFFCTKFHFFTANLELGFASTVLLVLFSVHLSHRHRVEI